MSRSGINFRLDKHLTGEVNRLSKELGMSPAEVIHLALGVLAHMHTQIEEGAQYYVVRDEPDKPAVMIYEPYWQE